MLSLQMGPDGQTSSQAVIQTNFGDPDDSQGN